MKNILDITPTWKWVRTVYLIFCICLIAKKVRRIQYNGYNYTDNSDSASHKRYLDRLEQQVKLMKELEKYFSKKWFTKNEMGFMEWGY